jgi:asparagine synthase (glutamine-hydrolysing)
MCGILGIASTNKGSFGSLVKEMLPVIAHRGPDEQSSIEFDRAALGHLRLSIVDLVSGQQPMKSTISSKYIVFNGEIYGYKDLYSSLNNYSFATNSDTEVILALYEQYGKSFLQKLPGMFSFAIWDDEKKSLFAARDRFGEKPFFYTVTPNGEIVFASEIKAILASKLVKPVLDFDSVAHYLKYLYVHPHKTIYKNIYTLPPAHSLSFESGKIEVNRYWQIPKNHFTGSYNDAVAQFKYLLDESVKKQLVADVPVGAFLSGGLDSSTIVALASKYNSKMETFSFGFDEAKSELPYARQIAKKYGTVHNEIFETDLDFASLILQMGEIYDEPFSDSSNIPTFLISKFASKLKVVLTGDGADELLAGYDFWYNPVYEFRNRKPKISGIRKLLQGAGFLKDNSCSVKKFYEDKKGAFTDNELSLILKKKISAPLYYNSIEVEDQKSLNTALNMDLQNYMPGDILVKTDRASMANSLELRAPFLDIDFASFCISLPENFKMQHGKSKYILRDAFQGLWTEDIINRPKQGFGAPVKQWLAIPSVIELKKEYLDDPLKKIFTDIISFENSRTMVENDNYQTWSLLVLSIWAEKNRYHI